MKYLIVFGGNKNRKTQQLIRILIEFYSKIHIKLKFKFMLFLCSLYHIKNVNNCVFNASVVSVAFHNVSLHHKFIICTLKLKQKKSGVFFNWIVRCSWLSSQSSWSHPKVDRHSIRTMSRTLFYCPNQCEHFAPYLLWKRKTENKVNHEFMSIWNNFFHFCCCFFLSFR